MPSTPTLPSLIPALKGDKGLYVSPTWDAGEIPYRKDSWLKHNNALWLALRKTSVEPSDAAPDDWFKEIDLQDVADSTESAAESAALSRAWASQPVGEDVEGAPSGSRSALHQAVRSETGASLSQAWGSQPVGEDVTGAAPGSRSAFHWATTAANAVSAGLTSISNAVSGGVGAIGSAASDALSALGTALSSATGAINTAGSTQTGNVNAAAAAQLNSIAQAIGAKFYASTADALSKGLASVTLGSGGSGATVTGQFPIGTSNGGGTQGLFLVNVAGGTITSIIKILNPGRGYASAPTTFDTSAIAGLTGATFIATIGQNRVAGEYFATPGAASPALFDFYVVATSTTATLVGSGPDLASVNELRNAGGSRNLHADPFFTESSVRLGLRGRSDVSPYSFGSGWTGIQAPPANCPYPAGKVLVRSSSNLDHTIRYALDQLEDPVYPGDVVEFGAEIAASAAGGAGVQNVLSYAFYGREGTIIGVGTTIASTTGNPLDTTFRLFRTGLVTVPANACMLVVSSVWTGAAQGQYWTGVQFCKGAIASKPVQRLPTPDAGNRIRALEDGSLASPRNNGVMRRTTHSGATKNFPQGTGTPAGVTFAAFGGYGTNYLAAACPAIGFNGIDHPWQWAPSEATGPARLTVIVRTAASGVNCLNRGRTIAWGWIDCDPSSGSAGNEPIQLLDPVTGAPKTVMPADLLDVFSISFFGTTKTGDLATGVFIQYCLSFSNMDPNFPGYSIPASPLGAPFAKFGPGYGSVNTTLAWYPGLLLMTGPVTATKTPSSTFAGAISASTGDLPPDLAALPQRIWSVVNMETWLYWFGMQHRPPSCTNFEARFTWAGSYPSNPSGQFEEGVCIKETAAGTKTLTLKASIGSVLYVTKTTSIKTAANTAGAGTTRRLLVLGSSLAQNAGINSEILKLVADTSINPGGAATGMNVVNVGTVGTAPIQNEGRSGQSIGIYFSPGDKFYNPGTQTFDITYYINTHRAGVAPTDIIIGDPFWSVASASSDAAAASNAAGTVNLIETMIASIAAWNTANPGALINTMIWFPPHQPEFGQDGEARSLVGSVMQHQRNRNLREAAKLYAATFTTAREANRIFALGFNVVGDASAATARYAPQPRNPGVRALISTTNGPYATHAAMVADAVNIVDTTIVQVGTPAPGSYWVKQGAGANGGFRPVNETDGFVRRIIDSTHGCPYREMAQQVFACMKNNL